MSFEKKRWLALAAGILIEMCSGIAYAWSVFQGPLIEKFACTSQQVTLVYTGNFWFSAIGFLFLGPILRKRMSIRAEVLLGSVMYAGSILATSFVQKSFLLVFLLFGVLRSLGMSFVYPVLMAYAVELFPERSGFASGMMTAGFGLGAMVWAPLATNIYLTTNDISRVFLTLGSIFAVVMLPLTFLLVNPAQGGPAAGNRRETPLNKQPPASLYNVNRKEMLFLPLFYITFAGFIFALSCGNLIVNQASPIMRNLFELLPGSAAFIVSVCSVSNVMGRVVCGPASDKLGKSRVAFLLLLLTTVMMLGLVVFRQQAVFTVCMLLVVFGYGGLASLVPPLTKELFGSTHFAGNYTVIYFVYAMASLIGPMVGTILLERTASYALEFSYGAALAALGAAALFLIIRKARALQTLQTHSVHKEVER
jgi:OFA family oxalate/formate antiporter-like MFS transporter